MILKALHILCQGLVLLCKLIIFPYLFGELGLEIDCDFLLKLRVLLLQVVDLVLQLLSLLDLRLRIRFDGLCLGGLSVVVN